MPEVSPTTVAFFRFAYGILLLLTLIWFLPHCRRFFVSERWRGYAQSSPGVDVIQNPVCLPLVLVLWLALATLLIVGKWTVAAAFINMGLCRYFFIYMRWRAVSRGMGAPGFMNHWLSVAVFLCEFSQQFAPACLSLVVLVMQIDFALIMLSSGYYKFRAGYPQNNGMELGCLNPQWGYWSGFYAKLSPGNWWLRTQNQLAWSTEVVAAILMLIPRTRFLGAALIMLSFSYVATQIRLAYLGEMVILGGALFVAQGGVVDQLLAGITPGFTVVSYAEVPLPRIMDFTFQYILWAYLVLLPFAHAGVSYNFYAGKRFTPRLQRALEKYTNSFGIIVWRVFTINLVNFFIRIYAEDSRGQRHLLSRYGWWRGGPRFTHVVESITVTCIFTTLKYYSSNPQLFEERLLRYAATFTCPAGGRLVFEYVSIRKEKDHFSFRTAMEFLVDPSSRSVEQRILDDSISVSTAHEDAPIHEGTRPGSYAPARP